MLLLRPLLDSDQIASLYLDPYIARVGHDHRAASPIDHPAARYVGAYAYGNLVGAFLVIESGYIEADVHALLKRAALRHSRELGRMILAQLFADTSLARVTAYVIEGLNSARNYCLKLGFKSEGMRRDACSVGGRLVGVHTLGITRTDWEKN